MNTQVNKNVCPECGNALVERKGKYGAFMGCSAYPECRYIKKDMNVLKKTVNVPETEEVVKQGFKPQKSKFDSRSAYVSYCKDLLIAMIENKGDNPEFDIVEASRMATQIITAMKAVFNDDN